MVIAFGVFCWGLERQKTFIPKYPGNILNFYMDIYFASRNVGCVNILDSTKECKIVTNIFALKII
jgi:hypothetical protein